ncbi:fibropellin-1-like [Pecten maximus]|uniref:fibropellin-1-like n=1 Tax=Pecten maximus TaxID=6579 RepID=UPI001458B6F8|nr:fibropellin-1-like [Pecten maximus]
MGNVKPMEKCCVTSTSTGYFVMCHASLQETNTPHGICDRNGSLVCTTGYFGPDCDVSCFNSTHGTCNHNGTFVCKTGFYGQDCDVSCTNTTHGACNENGTLICKTDSYGPNCNVLCANTEHGKCNLNGTLECEEHYVGTGCEIFCNNTLGDLCSCPSGYTGERCDVKLSGCSSQPCLNRGTCTEIGMTYECQCSNEYIGTNCEILNICAYSPCRHGQCTATSSGFHCRCKHGWTGFTCETDINECLQSVCPSGQTCINNFGSYTCLSCDNTTCQNNGTCSFKDHVPVCDCGRGWTGADCSIPDSCIDNPCGHYRGCEAFLDGYYCHYMDNVCSLVPCQNGGVCRQDGHMFTCKCPIGYAGKTCEMVDPCISQPCLNAATCTYDTNTFVCTCARGWIGHTCNIIDYCASGPCNNNSVCVNGNGNYTCVCPVGWKGHNCMTKDICFDSPCHNGSTCIASGSTFTCVCPPEIKREMCNSTRDKCDPSPCFNNALCETVGEAAVCYCLGGWDGNFCENDINECETSPCPKPLSCDNYPGGFRCMDHVFRRDVRQTPRLRPIRTTQSLGRTQLHIPSLVTKENVFMITQHIRNGITVRLCVTKPSFIHLLGFSSNSSFGNSTIEIRVLCGDDVIDKETVLHALQDFI